MKETRTWDGTPIADDDPKGASVIVYRFGEGTCHVLLLHRAAFGPDYEGDWAWTPPSGARQPGEDPEEGALRELKEESGLDGHLRMTECGSEAWHVYALEVAVEEEVVLVDPEHDRFEWVEIDAAIERCAPMIVSDQLRRFRQWVETGE